MATATTAQVTGREQVLGHLVDGAASAASRTQRSSSTCSMRSVTRILRGRPMSMAASIDAPMSSVWMWQFQRPSPPTTTIESPMPAHTSLKAGIDVVGRLEEVHDLVAQVGDVAVAAAGGVARQELGEHGPLDLDRLGHRPAVGHVEQHVEQQQEPGAAGVDHPGLGQHRQHLGGAGERVGALGAGGVEHRRRGRRRPSAAATAASDGLAHHGEDRALDRPHHRLVGRRRTPRRGRPAALAASNAVAPRPPRSTMPRRIWERITPELPRAPMSEPWLIALHTGGQVAVGAVELLAHRRQGERHVRAGVAVGHGVDVEPVDARLVGVERVPVARPPPRAAPRRRGASGTPSRGILGALPAGGLRVGGSDRRTATLSGS